MVLCICITGLYSCLNVHNAFACENNNNEQPS